METQTNFDLKEKVRAYWSGRAARFDESPSHRIEDRYGKPEWQACLRQAAGLGATDNMEGMHALDLACGTGEISRMLCSLDARVTGLDFSETMLAIARAKLEGQKWSPLLCDAEDLKGVKDNSIDFAVTRHLAWTLTNPAAAYSEWQRVLKPGGRLLINDSNPAQPFSLRLRIKRRIADWLRPEEPRSEEDRRTNTEIRKLLPYRDGLTSEQLKNELSEAGFTFVQTLDPGRLYGPGMRAWPIAQRLRLSSEKRFSLVFVKRTETAAASG